MKSKKTSKIWSSLTSLDYASSDFGIEEIATSYASEIANLRTANTELKNSVHDKSVLVNEVEQASTSDFLVSGVSIMNSTSSVSEPKVLHQNKCEQVADSLDRQIALVSKNTDELSVVDSVIHTESLQATVAHNEQKVDLFGVLRTRLDTTGESVKFRSNEMLISTSTDALLQNSLDSTLATSSKDSSFQADLSTSTTDDVDVGWEAFAQLQEFANQVMSKQEITPLSQSNDALGQTDNIQEEAKLDSRATLVDPQQVRESSQELFAAARNLLKRLHKN